MIRKRRFIAPEVIQVSAMDCGPASLKCFLDGAGVSVSYGRLREACQTDLDGTSIDTLEEVAVELGVDAEQVILPAEHLLISEPRTLPAIVVVSLPNGGNHFVVLWRLHGRFVQIMDPATGRRFTMSEQFLNEVYIHRFPVPADAWRKWAGTDEFTAPLRRRLGLAGLNQGRADAIIREALDDPSWRSIAALDAATRMIESMVRSGGLARGSESSRLLRTLFDKSATLTTGRRFIPEDYWSVTPARESADGELLITRGAVVIRTSGSIRRPVAEHRADDAAAARTLSIDLTAALNEPPARPLRRLGSLLKPDGFLIPVVILLGLFTSAFGVVFEALLFRGLLGIGRELGLPAQRLEALGALLIFAACFLVIEVPLATSLLRVGRRLETRLRVLFLEKLPRLGDRYFQSRLTSDMAERSHSLYLLRLLPGMAGQLIRLSFTLAFTTAGVWWLDPESAPLAILAAVTGLALPLITQRSLSESDLRVRTHLAGLSRFYLDALLGLVPIRTHGAERAIRREHESLLVEWMRSSLKLQKKVLAVDALQSLIAIGFTCWIVFGYAARAGDAGNSLLLIYWALSLPAIGQQIALTVLQYPAYRNIVLRLLEPLGAPADNDIVRVGRASGSDEASLLDTGGVELVFNGVSVLASGHSILRDINLRIAPGEHVAIVGRSGAGKSSLVGLLLGWHRPASGWIAVDGIVLDGITIESLRGRTAWIDPAVQLWNRTLLDNINYGAPDGSEFDVGSVIDNSALTPVLKKLPEGLQTALGEGGALVSGGEGQRVRLARGMMRTHASLAILDESFRGIDRNERKRLLANARAIWQRATLLYVTHDAAEAAEFDRVLVIEDGRLVEDDKPAELLKRDSRYRTIFEADQSAREQLVSTRIWRRLFFRDGSLHEAGGGS